MSQCEHMVKTIQREEPMRHILNEEVWKHVRSMTLSEKELLYIGIKFLNP